MDDAATTATTATTTRSGGQRRQKKKKKKQRKGGARDVKAPVIADDVDGMSVRELRAALGALNVTIPPRVRTPPRGEQCTRAVVRVVR